ncbi:hypothetical protein BC829DRAFT_406284 [Chytridium lagenaria]|nr:hypothetical protein BC829DRAFT_406284 [Chytridium lagenaria]
MNAYTFTYIKLVQVLQVAGVSMDTLLRDIVSAQKTKATIDNAQVDDLASTLQNVSIRGRSNVSTRRTRNQQSSRPYARPASTRTLRKTRRDPRLDHPLYAGRVVEKRQEPLLYVEKLTPTAISQILAPGYNADEVAPAEAVGSNLQDIVQYFILSAKNSGMFTMSSSMDESKIFILTVVTVKDIF